jgi:hypothetical protein
MVHPLVSNQVKNVGVAKEIDQEAEENRPQAQPRRERRLLARLADSNWVS